MYHTAIFLSIKFHTRCWFFQPQSNQSKSIERKQMFQNCFNWQKTCPSRKKTRFSLSKNLKKTSRIHITQPAIRNYHQKLQHRRILFIHTAALHFHCQIVVETKKKEKEWFSTVKAKQITRQNSIPPGNRKSTQRHVTRQEKKGTGFWSRTTSCPCARPKGGQSPRASKGSYEIKFE